ncbi:rhodanese-like domain-containing protein [Peijinzhouia sedimentorum]|tara:strand:- start:477 stop:866 length:390 start_codon:yes stop_codon:yes gene_type:complete
MNSIFKISILLIVISIAALACQNATTTEVIEPKEIDFEEFTEMALDENVVVLDVREPHEYENWHYDGAILMDYNNGQFEAEKAQLDKSKTYLLYCHTSRRSSAAALELAEMGIQSFYLKDGYSGLTINK